MDIIDAINQFRDNLETDVINKHSFIKAQHRLYRSSGELPGIKFHPSTDPLISYFSQLNNRELRELWDNLSAIKEIIEDLETMAASELNHRVFGTAEHTR